MINELFSKIIFKMMIEMDSKNLLYEGKAKSVFQGENPDEVT